MVDALSSELILTAGGHSYIYYVTFGLAELKVLKKNSERLRNSNRRSPYGQEV